MEWQHPEALYLILPLCAAWLVLALYSGRRRHVARETFAATAMWSRIFPEESRIRFWFKLVLREIAIISGLVALAGPRFGMQYEQVVPRGSDLYVLIDVSRSMLADDVPPSRLGRAKADVSSLVNRLEGERVGLIAFAGQAVVKCPLTVDYDSFRRALDELDPDSAPRGGTAIGDAIRKAIEVFHAKADRDQAVLLITDGDDQQSYPLEAAAVAAERHVTIFTIGLGDTERGARVPQRGANTFVEYEGQQVWSKLDNDLLRQIALKTSGVYVPAGTRAYDLGELYTNHLQGRRSADAAAQERIRRSERFQIFLGIALFSLLIDLCLGAYRRPKWSAQDDDDPDQGLTPRKNRVVKSGISATSKTRVVSRDSGQKMSLPTDTYINHEFRRVAGALLASRKPPMGLIRGLPQSRSAPATLNRSDRDLKQSALVLTHSGSLNSRFCTAHSGPTVSCRALPNRSTIRLWEFWFPRGAVKRPAGWAAVKFLRAIFQGRRPWFFEGMVPWVGRMAIVVFVLTNFRMSACLATEPHATVREGLRLYSSEKYEEAREKFAAAGEELDKQKSAAAAIAAFDEACAYHRQGDLEHARDSYLRAGLSQEIPLAVSAHFNLGNLSAEKARTLSGDKPETVPPDKRQEILDQLSQAVAAYRHCLELNHSHAPSRRNLELVRQWIKYYSDRWREQDRQKRRDESNLLQFLEYLIQAQTTLRETVNHLPESTNADAFAELKRVQDELGEEIPTLREKIARELRPPQDPNAQASPTNSKEVEEGISLLQSWADTAGQKMAAAGRQLSVRGSDQAVVEQKAAIEELDKIWEAVVPFHPLLSKELGDQSSIAKSLAPQRSEEEPPTQESAQQEATARSEPQTESVDDANAKPQPQRKDPQQLETANSDLTKLEERQTQVLNRARLLAPKAEGELQRMENMPAPQPSTDENATQDATAGAQPKPIDPEKVKEGYRKAIELAPQAVEQMEAAIKAIRQKDHQSAGQRAEDARKILDEIQQAQPKNEQPQDQQNQQKNDQQNQNQDDKQDQDNKKDEQKNDDKKEDQKPQDDQQKQDQKKQQPQVSQDRIEDALRKVRERQQEKRERDKKLKGQYFGKAPVDKDW